MSHFSSAVLPAQPHATKTLIGMEKVQLELISGIFANQRDIRRLSDDQSSDNDRNGISRFVGARVCSGIAKQRLFIDQN